MKQIISILILTLFFSSCSGQRKYFTPIGIVDKTEEYKQSDKGWIELNDKERIDGYTRIGDSIFGGEIACNIEPLRGIDIKSFKVLPGTLYAKDTNHVYYPLAIPCIDYTDCGVCYYGKVIVERANSMTFKYLGNIGTVSLPITVAIAAERGFLVLVDPLTGDLDLRVARNFEGVSLDKEEMKVSRTIIQEVVQTGEGLVTTDAKTDDRFAHRASVVLHSLRSILCVPLQARGETTGVVYVENKARSGIFQEHDRELLQAFATQAAVAIQNARLYTQTDDALAELLDCLAHLRADFSG